MHAKCKVQRHVTVADTAIRDQDSQHLMLTYLQIFLNVHGADAHHRRAGRHEGNLVDGRGRGLVRGGVRGVGAGGERGEDAGPAAAAPDPGGHRAADKGQAPGGQRGHQTQEAGLDCADREVGAEVEEDHEPLLGDAAVMEQL